MCSIPRLHVFVTKNAVMPSTLPTDALDRRMLSRMEVMIVVYCQQTVLQSTEICETKSRGTQSRWQQRPGRTNWNSGGEKKASFGAAEGG